MAARRKLSNPLALAVMVLLAERPMHPYEMARVMRQRGKEHSIKINYGSLYTVVQNLEKHGFVTVADVQRQGNRPERTLYGLTEEGRVEMHDWLADTVAVPAREYPAFEAGLSLIAALHPDEAVELLTERIAAVKVQAAAFRGVLAKLGEELPRLFLLETDYKARMLEAQADWIRELLAEIAAGELTGAGEWRSWHETGAMPDGWSELEEQFRDLDAADARGAMSPAGASHAAPGAQGTRAPRSGTPAAERERPDDTT
ncbi:PadR family transcriptional regulator [Actinacidiphila paucisporea]|uniref:Transcriptional regulator PadR-like family protein n=1 Tax=Actinacidiphila paucisporea TaxID=310782 RepID=A0A1M7J1B6_9ACTN|nr:PadR family transcriptional regulator [Actinacidiphila paucisporea]SHM46755.1 Transcriptional regulator PadR-like family protein [Actinacidiphila paucisporea]